MPELVILVPVLRRPHRVEPLLASVRRSAPDARVLFIASHDDADEQAAIRAAGADLLVVSSSCNYAAKINHGAWNTSEPLLFLGADDLDFHMGWFEPASARLSDGIGVVGTNDLCNPRVIRGEHATHFLVTRDYCARGTIDDPTRVLHEEYPHEMVDDEFIETAKHRGAYAHAGDSIVEHLHPMAGKAPMDDLYAAQNRRMRRGRAIYLRRRRLWT